MMKYFVDGDQLCVTLDDFVNLQESPSYFISLDSPLSKTIQEKGFAGLTIGQLFSVQTGIQLDAFQGRNPDQQAESPSLPARKVAR